MVSLAATVAQDPHFAGTTPQRLAAMMVELWTSGARVSRSPTADDIDLAHDDFANNDFTFRTAHPPPPLIPLPNYDGDHLPRWTISRASAARFHRTSAR